MPEEPFKICLVVKGWWDHGGVETFCRNVFVANAADRSTRFDFHLYGEVPGEVPNPENFHKYKGILGLLRIFVIITKQKPEVVLLNQPFSILLAPLIRLFVGCKVSYLIHIDYEKLGYSPMLMRIFVLLCNTFLDCVLSMTECNRKKLLDGGITVPVLKFDPPIIHNCEERTPWDDREIDILFFGRLARQKDPMFFLNVVERVQKKISRTKAAIVGDGELRDEVAKKIDELCSSDIKMFPGMVHEELAKIANSSKFFVLTSEYEGLGFVLVEAANWGNFVVAVDVPVGPSELLGERHPDLLHRDVEVVANHLVNLLSDDRNGTFSEQRKRQVGLRTNLVDRFEASHAIKSFKKILSEL